METKCQRAIQQPFHLERLLEAYITRSNVLPKDSYQIRNPDAVAAPLRRITYGPLKKGVSRHAYGVQQWLFTADMSLPISRERCTPVLALG